MVLDGIYVNGEKAKFNPEDILSRELPDYSEQVAQTTRDWLDENVSGGETIAVDASLLIEGAGADAKKVGDTFEALNEDLSELAYRVEVLEHGGSGETWTNADEVNY